MTDPFAPPELHDDNPYAAPVEVDRVVVPAGERLPPADRAARLGAWVVDLVITVACMVPGIAVMQVGAGQEDISLMFASTFLLWGLPLVLVIVYAVMLSRTGQTPGKRLVGIKVVRRESGGSAGFLQAVLLRSILHLTVFLLLLFAVDALVGWLYFLVDKLLILGNHRRCFHDFLGGTVVVNARPSRSRYRSRGRVAPDAVSA